MINTFLDVQFRLHCTFKIWEYISLDLNQDFSISSGQHTSIIVGMHIYRNAINIHWVVGVSMFSWSWINGLHIDNRSWDILRTSEYRKGKNKGKIASYVTKGTAFSLQTACYCFQDHRTYSNSTVHINRMHTLVNHSFDKLSRCSCC